MDAKRVIRRVPAVRQRAVSGIASTATDAPVTVPVIEETLEITKRRVDKGGYRISKRVTEEGVVVDEPLQQQTVEIERRPVGKTLNRGDIPQPRYEGNTWVVPVIKEVLVTEKRLVLVEEVRVTTLFGTHREPQQVTLRKEEVSIERLEADVQSAPELS